MGPDLIIAVGAVEAVCVASVLAGVGVSLATNLRYGGTRIGEAHTPVPDKPMAAPSQRAIPVDTGRTWLCCGDPRHSWTESLKRLVPATASGVSR